MTLSTPLPADDVAMMARLIALLDVETIEPDVFRGRPSGKGWTRVYGGQVVGQALAAVSRTVPPERLAHSLHAYFLRPGDPDTPIDYRVERDRDGRSFSTRRVVAVQHGRPIFHMAASFQVVEAGLMHAATMPAVPGPETLPSELSLLEAADEPSASLWRERDRPFEFRSVEGLSSAEPRQLPALAHYWLRPAAPVPDDPVLARCLLAYASDMTLLDTCLLPHGVAWTDPGLQVASLDHALWFHADPPLGDWLLFAQDSPGASGGRGINRGLIFAADGRLVATAMQEGLIRYRA